MAEQGGKAERAGPVEREAADAVTPRPAATVMVVRDGPHPIAPLEVLMLRRNLHADFVGGAYVFPGGAVDPGDGDPGFEVRCGGLSDARASETLGIDAGGLAYWVAAVRECFEEAGLVLACLKDGVPVSFIDADDAARFARHRAALNAREETFLEVCESERLSLPVDGLHYFAHWITPSGSPRRYDTRFFVTAAPEGQTPAHDAGETISDVWVRPAEALERHRAGDMEMILPTIRNLQAIGRFATAAELLDSAAAAGDVPTVLPRLVADGGGVRLLLPGDPGYDGPDDDAGGAGSAPAGVLELDVDAAVRGASRAANAPESVARTGRAEDERNRG